jgi:RimJ/RimL family protein N-acetyltransferase
MTAVSTYAETEGRKPMIAPLRPGVTLAHGPVIETERLRLRQWQGSDMAPYTAMLSDPVDEMTGWRHTVVMAGHWVIHGAGMFVVEEKSSGQFAGRVGPWRPPGWPGFEVGWGIAKEFRGRGYAVEAARASINWSFATYDIDRIVHCIDCENVGSQGVARRLGAKTEGEIELFGHTADLWVTKRDTWKG